MKLSIKEIISAKKLLMNSFSEEEFWKLKSVNNYFTKLSRNVTSKYKSIKPVFTQFVLDDSENADAAYTDDLNTVINPINSMFEGYNRKERFALCVGLQAHECGHILFTNFKVLKEVFQKRDMSLLDFSNCSKEFEEWSQKYERIFLKLLKDCSNIVEDPYVEYRIVKQYQGSFKTGIDSLRELLSDDLNKSYNKYLSEKDTGETISFDFRNLLLMQARKCLPEELKFEDEWIEVQELFNNLYKYPYPNTIERLNITLQMLDILFDKYIKEQFTPKPPKKVSAANNSSNDENNNSSNTENSEENSSDDNSSEDETLNSPEDNCNTDSSNTDSEGESGESDTSPASNGSEPDSDDEDDLSDIDDFEESETDCSENDTDETSSGDETFEDDGSDELDLSNLDKLSELMDNGTSDDTENSEDLKTLSDSNNGEFDSDNADDTEEADFEVTDENTTVDDESNNSEFDDFDLEQAIEDMLDKLSENSAMPTDMEDDKMSDSEGVEGDEDDYNSSFDDLEKAESQKNNPDEVLDDMLDTSLKNDFDEIEHKETLLDILEYSENCNAGYDYEEIDIDCIDEDAYIADKETIKLPAKIAANKIRDKVFQKKKSHKNNRQLKGSKVDVKAFAQRNNESDLAIFSNHSKPNKMPHMCISTVVDCSGSMCGSRIAAARRMALLVENFATQLQIPCSCIGHSTDGYCFSKENVEIYKVFDFNHSKQEVKKISELSAKNNNRDGFAFRYALNKIKKRPEPFKVIIIISDGLPAAQMYFGKVGKTDIQNFLMEAKKSGISVLSFNIGSDQKALEDIYGDIVDCSNLDDAPKNIAEALCKESRKYLY
ncbi:MAG: hypothetical protein SOY48_08650 [Eubacterium sp.]|nr:hypothetical protein [Eubacterium sp.]